MGDKVYVLARKDPNPTMMPNTNREYVIYGIYDSKEKALEACRAIKKYFSLVNDLHNLYNLEIVSFDINKSYNSDIVLIFDLHFNDNMEVMLPNQPEISYSNKTEPGFGAYCRPHSDVKDNEVYFHYNYNGGIIAKCKLNIDVMTIADNLNKLIGESKLTIIKEYYKRFSSLKEMVEKVNIILKPKYDFVKDSINLLEVKLDNYFKYDKESMDLFKSFLDDYTRSIENEVLPGSFDRSQKLLKELTIDNDIDKKIKDRCEKALSKFYWYKDEGSLNKGFKEFFIHGREIFIKKEYKDKE